MKNILDKTDKHTVVFAPANTPMLKRDRYKWSTTDSEMGTFLMVSKHDLNIDGCYQRGEVSKSKVLEIAKGWDWKLFGALSVVMRNDGSFWVYDGGHRARASFYRDDIQDLPCVVFEVDSIIDEAKAFIGANTMKSNVSAYHVYCASIEAREPNALAVKALLEKYGYEATLDGKKQYGLTAIHTLKKLVSEDAVFAEKCFALCVDIAIDGENIQAAVMRGIFHLAKRLIGKADIFAPEYRNKLIKHTIPGIEVAIRREKHICGRGGQLVEVKAILDIVNKSRRRKLIL